MSKDVPHSKRAISLTYFISLSLLANPVALANGDHAEAQVKPYLEGHHGFNLEPPTPYPAFIMYSTYPTDTWQDIADRTGTPLKDVLRLNEARVNDQLPTKVWAYAPPLGAGRLASDLNLPDLGSSLTNTSNDDSLKEQIATELSQLGTALNDGNERDYAQARATQGAERGVSNWLEQWFGGLGKLEVKSNVLSHLDDPSLSAKALVPLYEHETGVIFTQFGAEMNPKSTYQGRDFAHVGFGFRQELNEFALGLNTFFDRDLSRGHQRGSVGVEAWAEYLKLSSNYYVALSDWKDSPDFEDYQERPASGFDVNLKSYWPTNPSLGLDVTHEQYYGDEVGVDGTRQRMKDPYVSEAYLAYTPVPAVTLRTGVKKAKGLDSSFESDVSFIYRFGMPWSKQWSMDSVAPLRDLRGQRLDFVDRNHRITLEYKEKDLPLNVSALNSVAQALNSGDGYGPLELRLLFDEEDATANALSAMSNAHSSSAHQEYEVDWTLPEAFAVDEQTLQNQTRIMVNVPPVAGDYNYHATVRHLASGKFRDVTGTLTVVDSGELNEVIISPVSTLSSTQLERSDLTFDIEFSGAPDDVLAALTRYNAAYMNLYPLETRSSVGLHVRLDSSQRVQVDMDNTPLRSRLGDGQEPVQLMYGQQAMMYQLVSTKVGLAGQPLDFGDDMTIEYGTVVNFTRAATAGNQGTITYESSDTSVAEVNTTTGEVTIVGLGSSTITAKEAEAGEFMAQQASYNIHVTASAGQRLSFGPDVVMNFGDDVTGEGANVFTQAATQGNGGPMTYTSSNPSVATVEESSGTVTVLLPGATVITAHEAAKDGYLAQQATYLLTVDKTSGTPLEAGSDVTQTYQTLTQTPLHRTALGGNGGTIVYRSSDTSVATVDIATGAVTAVKPGRVAITMEEAASERYQKQTASYVLTIEKDARPNFELGPDMSVTYGDSVQGHTEVGARYLSSDFDVAVVNSRTGAVSIVGAGSTTITALVTEDEYLLEASDSYTITVAKAPGTALDVGETQIRRLSDGGFVAAYRGGNGSAISYHSSDPAVASIDAVGQVTSHKVGSTTITLTEAESANFLGSADSFVLQIIDGGTPLNAGPDVLGKVVFDDVTFTQVATGGNGGALTYRSDNEHVATVDDDGQVTIHNAGAATITVDEAAYGPFLAQSDSYVLSVSRKRVSARMLKENVTDYFDISVPMQPNSSTSEPVEIERGESMPIHVASKVGGNLAYLSYGGSENSRFDFDRFKSEGIASCGGFNNDAYWGPEHMRYVAIGIENSPNYRFGDTEKEDMVNDWRDYTIIRLHFYCSQ